MEMKKFFIFVVAFVLVASLFSDAYAGHINLLRKRKRSAQGCDTRAVEVDWCNSAFLNYLKFEERYLEINCPPAEK